MLIAKLRYQGVFIAGLFILLMLGSFVPDPFSRPQTMSTPANFFKSAQDYFRLRMKYAAFAPLVRGLVGYNLNSSLTFRAYIGRNHHLYFAEDNATAQSFGDIYRRAEIVRFADIAAILQRELRKDGADLIVAIAPNAQSVAVEDLPLRPTGKELREYDLALAELKNRSIRTSDIRSVLLAYGDGNALYRLTDTHWNNLGALLAFNSVVTDAGYPQWTVPWSVLGPATSIPGGDLARFLGIQDYIKDFSRPFIAQTNESWKKISIIRSLPPAANVFENYTYERNGGAGSHVLVLGDSFSMNYWLPFFQSTSDIDRIGWMHHSMCAFDFRDVRLFAPTLVIWMPTERAVPCPLEKWPLDLPKE